MSGKWSSAPRGGSEEAQLERPRLESMLQGAGHRLASRGAIGLISVTVLQRRHVEQATGWHGYDAIIHEIGSFLRIYHSKRMRREDRLFKPRLNGNSCALLIEPPRDGRDLDASALARVCARIKHGLRTHLARSLPLEAGESFGACVGAALVNAEHGIPFARWRTRLPMRCAKKSARDTGVPFNSRASFSSDWCARCISRSWTSSSAA